MTNNRKWQPLEDIWKNYFISLMEAAREGNMESAEDAEDIIWPSFLHIADSEKSEVNDFLMSRTQEFATFLEDQMNMNGRVNTNLIASFIFRSLLSGMIWERERIGR